MAEIQPGLTFALVYVGRAGNRITSKADMSEDDARSLADAFQPFAERIGGQFVVEDRAATGCNAH